MSREPLSIVILGASFAGFSVAHHFLDNVLKSLRLSSRAPKYRVVLISPSTHFYWNVGAPRALVSPTRIPHSQSFIPIEEGFKQHPFTEFIFKQGTAIAIDTSARNVTIVLPSPTFNPRSSRSSTANRKPSHTLSPGHRSTSSRQSRFSTIQTVPYHALVIATGSSAISSLLSLHGSHENTINALKAFHDKLDSSKSILIVGGGPSGIECAGQLATYSQPRSKKWRLGRKQPDTEESKRDSKGSNRLSGGSWKSDKQLTLECGRRSKIITLLSGSGRLLPNLAPSIGAQAEKKLKRLGVHVVHNIRQLAVSENPDGTVKCHLNNDMTITADQYIAATGVEPNTAFLPPELVNGDGYVVTDPAHLRVPCAGDRVYAIGDCASYSRNCIRDVYDALPVLMHNMRNDLLAYELRMEARTGFEEKVATLQDMSYEQNQTMSQLIPVERRGGVGVISDIRVPSVLVHWLKGRDHRVGKAKDVVERGHHSYSIGWDFLRSLDTMLQCMPVSRQRAPNEKQAGASAETEG